MTCKDCINFDVCCDDGIDLEFGNMAEKECPTFKSEADWKAEPVTCKDCIHYCVCHELYKLPDKMLRFTPKTCDWFQNKND